jgi:hypothetical protein
MTYTRGTLQNWAGQKPFNRKTTQRTLLAVASKVDLDVLTCTISTTTIHELVGVPTAQAASELRHLADLRHITLRPVDGHPGLFAVRLLL